MLDMLVRCGAKDKTTFVFFDTGLEYAATKEHLTWLEQKYGIEIVRRPPVKPIPKACKESGTPFWSKDISHKMYYLQQHGFQWEDGTLDELAQKYPGCRSVLAWWCNARPGERFNISHTPYMKEFIMKYPPTFKVSDKCCDWAKKQPSHKFEKQGHFDLVCLGIRKSEGGARATAYKNCFSQKSGDIDRFRPVFWLRDKDKDEYCSYYGVTHSRCYTEYGLTRTGCFGCPFNKRFHEELERIREHEPQLFKAANNIFGESYDYTLKYLAFREEMKAAKKR